MQPDAVPLIASLREHAGTQPARTALVFEGHSMNFAEFERHTNQVAHALAASGIAPGERGGDLMPHTK